MIVHLGRHDRNTSEPATMSGRVSYDSLMGLLRRLFLGDGQLPGSLRAELEAEGAIVLAEGLAGSITLRDFRRPGYYASWEKFAVAGALAITRRRIVIWISGGKSAWTGKHMDVPLDDARLKSFQVTTEESDKICIAYDPHAFHADWSGRIEVRLKTPKAEEIAAILATT